jgi:hypothetical protein
VVGLTYSLTKKREREAEWRRLKLDHYREFLLALSGIVENRATRQAHARYADAHNALIMVAPGRVITKLYAFLDETSYRNRERTQERHDELFSELVSAIRCDVQPGPIGNDEPRRFRLVGLPPEGQTPDHRDEVLL